MIELDGKQAVLEKAPAPTPPSLVGQSHDLLNDKSEVVFIIPVSGRQVNFPMGQDIIVGRSNPETNQFPDLDLIPDGGSELGVSRVHALFTRDENGAGLVIIDKNSTNGTKLNFYPIPAELPYPIKSGDEIHFGNLLVHVFIK